MKKFVFSDLPITKKLMWIMHGSTLLAVLFASAFFGASEAISYRQATIDQIATLGGVIGTNSTAAITFEDSDLADQVLRSLDANDEVMSSHIFLSSGELFSSYHREDTAAHDLTGVPDAVQSLVAASLDTNSMQQQFAGLRYVDAVRPIVFDAEVIGYLHLRTSLGSFVATLQRIAIVALIVMLMAVTVAYILSSRLQSTVSFPILQLSGLMKRVSDDQDYSVRARPQSGDEIGVLMRGFNDMLEQITLRDEKLAYANQELSDAFDETLRAKEAAELASSAKSDFLARMSHEIRTPMNGVLGMTELLMSSDLSGSKRKFAETIQHSGEALLAVINDILDFSKVEAGKLMLEESDFDVCDAVEGIVDLLYTRAQQRGVDLICAIDPSVTEFIHGDAIRLRQVLMNLVGNAIKFTSEGSIIVGLTQCETQAGEPELQFYVQDTGIGISSEQLDLVFDSFAQADVSTTREYGGTGLGLAISKQLVELMGGEISVESIVGQGSTFKFSIPLKAAEQKSAHAEFSLDPLVGIRVLIVDDNEINRDVFSQQLSSWQAEVSTAESAAAAVNQLESATKRGEKFDLVLLDFYMPETDGMELAATIRSRSEFGQPGLLMLSSAESEIMPTRSEANCIDLYLPKPVRRAVLHSAMVSVLQEGRVEQFETTSPLAEELSDDFAFGLRALLVEDIPVNMQVAKLMLASVGCEVVEATNGQEALQSIAENRPDIVFMDCQMPVMDGYSASRSQRARESKAGAPRLPIVALTANALAEDRQKCIDAGMDDFVSKPFRKEDLVEVLQRITGKSGITVSKTAHAEDVPLEQSATPAPMPDGPAIDRASLDQINDLDPNQNGELLNNIIDTYCENAEVLILELMEAAKGNDLDTAVRAAHSLKSSSANVGAQRLAALCRSMERHGREGDISGILENLDPTWTEYETAIDELVANKTEVAA
jgi:signal transduction histidine kinase/DNA-binding response OmpR family regulator/HPt (histidine-containing phosphotransfer) domain-containing protein